MEDDVSRNPYCHECKRPLMAIDFYGEQLKGCLSCNIWWTENDTKKRLSEVDLRALHGMVRHSHRDD